VFVAVAIEMWFSKEGDERVRQLWSALETRGVTSLGTATHRRHVPHVSLTVVDRLPAHGDALSDIIAPALCTTLRLSAVGGFPGVATFLVPAHHQSLAATHHLLHEAFIQAGVPVWENYAPGSWVPHCTMSFWDDDTEISHLAAVAAGLFPIEVNVASINGVDSQTGVVVTRLG
jgi:2'-5' RNA ligase superfamily